jgi:hypothetical protein
MRVLVVVAVLAMLAAFPGASVAGAGKAHAKRQLTGIVTSVSGGTITVRSGSRSLTCALARGTDLRAVAGARVRLTCRSMRGRLTATRVRSLGQRLSLEVNGQAGRAEARGVVIAVTASSITVQSGSFALTCGIPAGMDLSRFAGRTVEMHCRLAEGAWVVTRIEAADEVEEEEEIEVDPARGRAEVRGTVTSVSGGQVTVSAGSSSFSCNIPNGADLSPFLGRFVELECVLVAGVWTVQKIETEDGGPEIEVEFGDDEDDRSGPGGGDDDDDDRSGPGGGDDDDDDDDRSGSGGGDDDDDDRSGRGGGDD